MRRSIGTTPALAFVFVLLAACSTSPPAPSPAPAPPAAGSDGQFARAREMRALALTRTERIAVTGARYSPAPFLVPGNRFATSAPNKPLLVAEHPVSTFSADVDTASYAYLRRVLTEGRVPSPDAVRVEEMVNYFPYQYSAPRGRGEPFAVTTEVMPSPWNPGNQLVHIGVRGFDLHAAERPRANVVLLVDVSGSMQSGDRLPLLKQGFHLFASQLRDDDQVAIVTYASDTRVALEPTPGKDKQKILAAIEALRAGGSTSGGEGLQRAYALAESNFDAKAVNRVILATDGDFNVGITDPRQLEQFIASRRKAGVYLSVFGVGEGNLNDALMQRLAQSGNGQAAYIDSLLEARKAMGDALGSTMFPIANDVKLQVEFNPGQVQAYRLIGYETRMLDRQDFNNDKVDAGDMAAGHTVTAIYEITPVGASTGSVDPLRYGGARATPAAGAKGDELCYVKLRYKLPGEASSRLVEHAVRAAAARKGLDAVPDEQRFAVAVAAFGQRLRGEPQLADYSYADIATLANSARGTDPDGYRAEFVRLVRMADALSTAGSLSQR
ncbi:VWA domain-containing protein [Massilia solisilvae]|uniref:VWA domain-containing protein n=1 Tax=Massilia solisilvae TaxID=1811225 RepID=A0ABT2BIF8_9BURK|nr:VWA domain-containing protein [Massilia solisilvae]MCS0608297.1 VWA domain-containing protein [Massilia solisilvae]